MLDFIKKLFAPKAALKLADEYEPIPKFTHPGKLGKYIYCKKCRHSAHVTNFKWADKTCTWCETNAIKQEWLLKIGTAK
jgi:hypothetical protein